MKPVDISPITPTRRLGNEVAQARANERSAVARAAPAADPAMVETTDLLAAGDTAPVDTDRVAQIRDALREGRYPLLPARISDQMIAAGFVLIDSKE